MAAEIDIHELRKLIVELIEHVIANGGDKLLISDDEDFYWDVFWDDINKLDVQPGLGFGRLSDDLELLKSTAAPDSKAALSLEHAAALLRYVGHKYSL